MIPILDSSIDKDDRINESRLSPLFRQLKTATPSTKRHHELLVKQHVQAKELIVPRANNSWKMDQIKIEVLPCES